MRPRCLPCVCPRAPSRKPSFTSAREASRAGKMPNRRAVKTDKPKVNASTGPSTWMVSIEREVARARASRSELWPKTATMQAQGSADQRQHAGSRSDLADQRNAAGAQGGADGHLPVAGRGAGKQQAGDVGATDEQHQRDCAEENQQNGLDLAHHGLVQRSHLRGRRADRFGATRAGKARRRYASSRRRLPPGPARQ